MKTVMKKINKITAAQFLDSNAAMIVKSAETSPFAYFGMESGKTTYVNNVRYWLRVNSTVPGEFGMDKVMPIELRIRTNHCPDAYALYHIAEVALKTNIRLEGMSLETYAMGLIDTIRESVNNGLDTAYYPAPAV